MSTEKRSGGCTSIFKAHTEVCMAHQLHCSSGMSQSKEPICLPDVRHRAAYRVMSALGKVQLHAPLQRAFHHAPMCELTSILVTEPVCYE